MREREEWIEQENEHLVSQLPNHLRPYWKLVTMYSELQEVQCKLIRKFIFLCWAYVRKRNKLWCIFK